MCGIVGYLGTREAVPILIEGLRRLEYRGYDSAGVAVSQDQGIKVIKKAGKLNELDDIVSTYPPAGQAGIGHTRWATHGRPSDCNSHPHTDCQGDFVVVHNGIIENFQELKEELLERGHNFDSETDTEVIAHLLEERFRGNLRETVLDVVGDLDGSYALAVMYQGEPDRIIVVRQDSPLIVGVGQGENYIASDIPAFLNYTNQFYILDDGELAEVMANEIQLYDDTGRRIEKELFVVDWDAEMAEKGGYEHFMLKEIYEEPDAIRRVLSSRVVPGEVRLDELNLTAEEIKAYDKIDIVACGTASYAGQMGKYVIEELVQMPVEVSTGSEFRYRQPLVDDKSLVIVVSQSGETADTLASLRLARQKGARVLAFTNVVGSSIDREADDVLYLRAGPEIAVASTKAYITMITAFYILALYLARVRETVSQERLEELIEELLRLPELAADTIDSSLEKVRERADVYKLKDNAFFIGRNTDYALSLEGSLKLKEISYIHAEAYPAGELKHGPLALIEDGIPVVAIATRMSLFDKMLSNVKEVKARGADVLAITFAGEKEVEKSVDHVIYIPRYEELFSGVLAIIPLHLLAYYTSLARGYDVDQPRNLAKSVTVE